MKILTAAQVKAWDHFTIQNEPISSIALMERAAAACVKWILTHYPSTHQFSIFCGKGNNGGDGLAIARMLAERGKLIQVHVLEFGFRGTDDFQTNLSRLHQYPQVQIQFIQSIEHIHPVPPERLVIDALFGVGLHRELNGLAASVVSSINQANLEVVSIDLPSGLFADQSSPFPNIIKATHTLTLECIKPALLFQENESYVGQLTVIPIGLHPEFLVNEMASYEWVDSNFIRPLVNPRKRTAHKGNFGHALLIAGSEGKMGAATLSARATLRAGVGLLTCQVPKGGNTIMQVAVPEAMTISDKEEKFISMLPKDLSVFNAIGIGPGIGQEVATKEVLVSLIKQYRRPLVFDADALNIISGDPSLLNSIPAGSILTPHLKEFERLFGPSPSDYERMSTARDWAEKLQIIIIIKGSNSMIFNIDRRVYFNSTGNPGMATGGTGDVLTGLITSLLAQGYPSLQAALLGVYLHGKAGDLAAAEISQEALMAGDIIDFMGSAWKSLSIDQSHTNTII